MIVRIFVIAIGLTTVLTSCFPTLLSNEEPPSNPGRTDYMVIQAVAGHEDKEEHLTVRSTIENEWSREPSYQSWFFIVDDIKNLDASERSVILNPEIISVTIESEQRGNRKHGFYTVHTTKADISLKITDVQTNEVLAIAQGKGSVSRDTRGPNDHLDALREATQRALYKVVRTYSGQL